MKFNIIKILKETYSASIGVEFLHIQQADQKQWVQERIEEVRNQLATETDVTKRDELELENKNLISQKKSECSDQFSW